MLNMKNINKPKIDKNKGAKLLASLKKINLNLNKIKKQI